MRRFVTRLLALAGILAILLAVAGYAWLRASAPQLDGSVMLAGLSAPVTVNRDQLGVPSIHANSRLDAARVLGYLHAQDRFFQMDLMRRLAAGELSALVGPAALKVDERHRLFRLRAVAREVLQQATPEQRKYIQAYTDGVNAGLHALRSWPFEYALLRQRPGNWQPADSVLVIFAMYFDLQDAYDRRESDLALMRATLPAALFNFLNTQGTRWDAPLAGQAFATPAIPSSNQADIHDWPKADFSEAGYGPLAEPPVIGSNSFAVDAAHSADGHAILATDMHLGLAVPNIWYRAQLIYPDSRHSGTSITTTGVTLPGLPVIVAGSNQHVAWGFTNSYGDWVDRVMLHLKADDPGEYLTPKGWRPFTQHQEIIKIAGHTSIHMEIRESIWGPVSGRDPNGIPYALHWVAEDPAATNLELGDMDQAQNEQQAMAVANRAGMPEQNFLVADADGNIAWTIAGRIPVRSGYDPNFPAYWDKSGVGWLGWLAPDRYPRIVNPADGRLWTANNRVVDGDMLKLIGNGGYDLGARARQLRNDLMARDKFSPVEMLAIQLDDRAVFLQRWRALLLQLLTQARIQGHARRTQFLHYVLDWGGRANIDSVGYRLVRDFRERVEQMVFGALTAPCKKLDPDFDYHVLSQREGPLWAMVTQQPDNLLDPEYPSWDELLLAAVDQVDKSLWVPGSGLVSRTWGQHNTVHIRQPMSRGLHVLSHWLNMAPVELPGDSNMPRVQGVSFGASERLDVEPGHEQNGIFEMPTGQSGYPLSPFYRNSQPAWEQGIPAPFLPGKARHTLVFQPSM
ncbi:MAG: penicillin acylase family protein [Gammaproteobacteria bacterium]|nr:penicillin acylase family protein [Gammaproteobacteria bacterium]MDE2345525.1 penicillin acylase family protein [Gammaproteobacteria bacterium]